MPPEIEYVLIPYDDGFPIRSFEIGKYPVTIAQWRAFDAANSRGREHTAPDDNPVTGVTWEDAMAFCYWAGCYLPTEHEWWKAAAWDPSKQVFRVYPWGDEFKQGLCNTKESGFGRTRPVNAYPDGVSAYGCYDMAGNVWEWTNSLFSDKGAKVTRGGAWSLYHDYAACVHRCGLPLDHSDQFIGFRCARKPVISGEGG